MKNEYTAFKEYLRENYGNKTVRLVGMNMDFNGNLTI